jgi:metal-sulfur cluster biosynthetic enzyme
MTAEPTDEPADGVPTPDRVRAALEPVTDPELDRSIVELDYVDDVTVESSGDGAAVRVAFTLPTAWCSPAFAWMMAVDARDAVEALPSVDECTVELREHMHEAEVNRGVNEGLSFAEAFPDAEDGVADLRATLDEKAVLSRQYAAVESLLEAGLDLEQVARLERGDLDRDAADDGVAVDVPGAAFAVVAPAADVDRYLEKARSLDYFAESDRLFRTPDGDPIAPGDAELVHRRARLAQVNMDGQGGVCDALHRARQSGASD